MIAPRVISLDLDDTLWPVTLVLTAAEIALLSLLRVAGVEPAEVLHIGDDPLADVVGATRAGMQAVWLNREGRPWPDEFAPPPCTVSTLAEIC